MAPPGGHSTHRGTPLAVRLVVEDGVPYRPTNWHLWRDHRVCVPFATIQHWVEAGGKKAPGQLARTFLDGALATFSGYVAVDELSEGPSCVLAAVDKRQDKRMVYEGLDHEPCQDDIDTCLGRLHAALEARHVARKGITTAGSARAPAPIRTVCGAVPHPRCLFQVLKERTKGLGRAVASERERLGKSKPKVKRGRPSPTEQAARRVAPKSQSMQEPIRALFQARFVCVTRQRTRSERKRLLSITRGLPHLRTRRESLEHSSALFDRRCRTPTARGKLRKLRHWVKRVAWIGHPFPKVCSPHLDQALTWLDDTVWPATANAVERGNRRHRTRPKRVYRVRSKACVEGRIALDMIRESRAEDRDHTTQALHQARRGAT